MYSSKAPLATVSQTALKALAHRVVLHRAGALLDHLAVELWEKYGPSDRILSCDPLINRGSFIRAVSIDKAIQRDADVSTVLVLGCGFDTRADRHPSKTFIGVDRVEVEHVKNFIKADVCASSRWLQEAVDNFGFDTQVKCLIIVECLLMYLPMTKIESLIEFISRRIPQGRLLLFEPITSQDHFAKQMSDNLNRSLEEQTYLFTLECIKSLLRKSYEAVRIKTMLELEAELADELKRLPICQLDEREQWEMLAAHYVFIEAAKAEK